MVIQVISYLVYQRPYLHVYVKNIHSMTYLFNSVSNPVLVKQGGKTKNKCTFLKMVKKVKLQSLVCLLHLRFHRLSSFNHHSECVSYLETL